MGFATAGPQTKEERDRGGIRRASTAMTNPAEQRDRAGRANPYPEEYQ
jgi:hypothetical protein